ncbi:MAG TPA: aminotransferase class III-fold pyridoxal phosphate-dependent enzyme, partial [bacterium]|nr:aminotransferase class III-fold pyridoxal phosphate-dependent enzyme [bacterium]
MTDHKSDYGAYTRPMMYDLLKTLRLDIEYTRGAGDYLFFKSESGEETPVLDLAGGFGATILGHNHPEIKKVIKKCVDKEIPMHAQGSVRESTGKLAARLSSLYPGKEKRMVMFSNSGTEAVEALLKHAEMNRMNRFMEIGKSLFRNYNKMRDYYRMHSALRLPKEYREKGVDALLGDIIMQTRVLESLPPVVICAERSFHGKTASAVQITGNPMYREAFARLSAIEARFVEFGNLDEI